MKTVFQRKSEEVEYQEVLAMVSVVFMSPVLLLNTDFCSLSRLILPYPKASAA